MRLLYGLAAGLTGLALCATLTHGAPGKLRYTAEYTRYMCRLERAAAAGPEASKKAPDQKPKRMFPSEFANSYVPQPYEWFELVKTPLQCSHEYMEPKPNYRCRLDRVVFRDRAKDKTFTADSARVGFRFVHSDPSDSISSDSPGPIGGQTLWRTTGWIDVRGHIDGKPAILSHEWNHGSPAEVVYVDKVPDGFRPSPRAKLPVVTSENWNLYVFAIPPKWAGSVEPYIDMTFVPEGCQV